jgi:predicted RNase H-like HicB family nuclease
MIAIIKGSGVYFGFDVNCPAVCAQANTIKDLRTKIKKVRQLYLNYMKTTQSGGDRLGA